MWVRNVHCERKGGGDNVESENKACGSDRELRLYRTLKDDGWWHGHKEQTVMEIVLTRCKKRIHY